MSSGRRVGQLIRRSRLTQRLSQQALADLAGVSQAVVSYYESGRASPSRQTIDRLEQALGLEPGGLTEDLETASGWGAHADVEDAMPRSGFLDTLDISGWGVATFDRPAGTDGGDVAFAVDLRSHVFLIVIDAQGSGRPAAFLGRAAAACAFGATTRPGGGVPFVEDIVEALVRFWRMIGLSPQTAAICAMCFDRRSRTVQQCRLGVPPPYLRSDRLGQWTGTPDGPAGSYVGQRALEPGSLLVVATDGVANLATRGERTLWDSAELRNFLAHAGDPQDVVDLFRRRVPSGAPGEREDDRLAVVVMP